MGDNGKLLEVTKIRKMNIKRNWRERKQKGSSIERKKKKKQ